MSSKMMTSHAIFLLSPPPRLLLASSSPNREQPTCCGCCVNWCAAGCCSCKTTYHVYPTNFKKAEDHDKHIVRLPPSSAAC